MYILAPEMPTTDTSAVISSNFWQLEIECVWRESKCSALSQVGGKQASWMIFARNK